MLVFSKHNLLDEFKKSFQTKLLNSLSLPLLIRDRILNFAHKSSPTSHYLCQYVNPTEDKTQTLQQVAGAIEQINDTRAQSNIAASTAVKIFQV